MKEDPSDWHYIRNELVSLEIVTLEEFRIFAQGSLVFNIHEYLKSKNL